MGKIKRVVQKVAPLLVILIGIGILCYPFIAQYLYRHQKNTEIKTYDAKVEQMDEDQIKKYFEEARKYNIYLSTHVFTLTDPFVGGIESADVENYNDILNVEENGVMVGQTVYKMNGSTLANYMKYNYKYDDNKRMIESETLKWNSTKEEWEKDLRINYTYEGKTVTTNYYKWNNKKRAYVLVPEMTVTMDNTNL